ncbi:MAG: helix-turn-helix domain-containing protein [Desulfobulbaceae bacterium]|nr:MAG: helix-turn-helix domain-containing protein [Desulfobulbaceae bacterium]
MQKQYLSTREVAQLLHVNEKVVYSLISDKGLPASKVTGKWLFPRHLVEEWLDCYIVNSPVSGNYTLESGRLYLAGSDDLLLQKALEYYNRQSSESIGFFANIGSMGGIKALRQGVCHVAACHLLQDDNEQYNFNFIDQELERSPVFINFSRRQQGILIAKGNPKQINSVTDLASPDVTIVNRPLSTGTRLLLDYEISKANISSDDIQGYRNEVARHLDAGLAILSQEADAAPAIRPVADLLGLDFLPLRWERFDLVISRDRFFEQAVQKFVNILHDPAFKKMAEGLKGYDLSFSGKMLYPDNAPI